VLPPAVADARRLQLTAAATHGAKAVAQRQAAAAAAAVAADARAVHPLQQPAVMHLAPPSDESGGAEVDEAELAAMCAPPRPPPAATTLPPVPAAVLLPPAPHAPSQPRAVPGAEAEAADAAAEMGEEAAEKEEEPRPQACALPSPAEACAPVLSPPSPDTPLPPPMPLGAVACPPLIAMQHPLPVSAITLTGSADSGWHLACLCVCAATHTRHIYVWHLSGCGGRAQLVGLVVCPVVAVQAAAATAEHAFALSPCGQTLFLLPRFVPAALQPQAHASAVAVVALSFDAAGAPVARAMLRGAPDAPQPSCVTCFRGTPGGHQGVLVVAAGAQGSAHVWPAGGALATAGGDHAGTQLPTAHMRHRKLRLLVSLAPVREASGLGMPCASRRVAAVCASGPVALWDVVRHALLAVVYHDSWIFAAVAPLCFMRRTQGAAAHGRPCAADKEDDETVEEPGAAPMRPPPAAPPPPPPPQHAHAGSAAESSEGVWVLACLEARRPPTQGGPPRRCVAYVHMRPTVVSDNFSLGSTLPLPNEQALACAARGGTACALLCSATDRTRRVMLWDALGGEQTAEVGSKDATCLAWGAEGPAGQALIATGGASGTVELYRLQPDTQHWAAR
jgi:hypothetical protein